jgi:hypothetical protein
VGHQGQEALLELVELAAVQDLLELVEHLAHQDQMALLEPVEHLVRQVQEVLLEPVDHLVLVDHLGQAEALDLAETSTEQFLLHLLL